MERLCGWMVTRTQDVLTEVTGEHFSVVIKVSPQRALLLYLK